jgi:hypothetical protein
VHAPEGGQDSFEEAGVFGRSSRGEYYFAGLWGAETEYEYEYEWGYE